MFCWKIPGPAIAGLTLSCLILSGYPALPCVVVEKTQPPDLLSNLRHTQAGHRKPNISLLCNRDITLIIDRSNSMMKRDCPPADTGDGIWQSSNLRYFQDEDLYGPPSPISRWQWCEQQALEFASQAEPIRDDGVTVVVFSSHFQVHKNVRLRNIPEIFSINKPDGTTDTTRALKSQLDDYFDRKYRYHGRIKPLLIALISDDGPDDAYSLRHEIIDCTKQMSNREEIVIAFLQIGTDLRATRLFQGFKRDLATGEAKFNITSVTPFSDLCKDGLSTALVNALISTEHLANDPDRLEQWR